MRPILDPFSQALLSAGATGMQASGPSLMPRSLGQIIGGAGQAGMESYRQAQKDQINQAFLAMQIQQMLAKQKADQRQQEMLSNFLSNIDSQPQAAPQQGVKMIGSMPSEAQAIEAVRAASAAGLPATIGGPNPTPQAMGLSGGGQTGYSPAEKQALALAVASGNPAKVAELLNEIHKERNKYSRMTPAEQANLNLKGRAENRGDYEAGYRYGYSPNASGQVSAPVQPRPMVPRGAGVATQSVENLPEGFDSWPPAEKIKYRAEQAAANAEQKRKESMEGLKPYLARTEKTVGNIGKLTNQIRQFAERISLITGPDGKLLPPDSQVYTGLFGGIEEFGARIMLEVRDMFGGKIPDWLPNLDPNREDRYANTKLLEALMGREVFESIRELGVGARGIDTPAEREFLRDVLSGRKEWDAAALKKFFEYRKKYLVMAAEELKGKIDSGEFDKWNKVTPGAPNKLELLKKQLDSAIEYSPKNLSYGGAKAPQIKGTEYPELPRANKSNRGKFAYDDEKDQWYKSDGMRWVPINKPN